METFLPHINPLRIADANKADEMAMTCPRAEEGQWMFECPDHGTHATAYDIYEALALADTHSEMAFRDGIACTPLVCEVPDRSGSTFTITH